MVGLLLEEQKLWAATHTYYRHTEVCPPLDTHIRTGGCRVIMQDVGCRIIGSEDVGSKAIV